MIFVFSVVIAIALVMSCLLVRQYIGYLLERARGAEAEAAELRDARDASLYAELVGRTVVILTTERQSYRGVLAQAYADGLRLVSPALIQDSQPAALGGEVFIERAKIALIQIPNPPSVG